MKPYTMRSVTVQLGPGGAAGTGETYRVDVQRQASWDSGLVPYIRCLSLALKSANLSSMAIGWIPQQTSMPSTTAALLDSDDFFPIYVDRTIGTNVFSFVQDEKTSMPFPTDDDQPWVIALGYGAFATDRARLIYQVRWDFDGVKKPC